MELNELKNKYAEFIASLADDMKAKVNECKTVEELKAIIDDYDGELPDDIVEAVAGGKGGESCSHLNPIHDSRIYNTGYQMRNGKRVNFVVKKDICTNCHRVREVYEFEDGSVEYMPWIKT